MTDLTFLLGGARGGKSSYAQRLAASRGDRVLYIATARALDEEIRARIDEHRRERPESWETREVALGVGRLLQDCPPDADVILLDCLTMLVTNVLMDAAGDVESPDEAAAQAAVSQEIDELLEAIRQSRARWIVVSNEVGLGLVPPYPLGRLFRDLLGWVNQRFAQEAGEVYWLAAGIPVPLHAFRGIPTPEGFALQLHPIGRVVNNFNEPAPPDEIRAAPSRILLNPELAPGLEGLEVGQRILVLFYFHRSEGYDLAQHPRGDPSRPMRGVFALRSPRRPNPIGATEVVITALEGHTLEVLGLDAIDGTPVLDIKPA